MPRPLSSARAGPGEHMASSSERRWRLMAEHLPERARGASIRGRTKFRSNSNTQKFTTQDDIGIQYFLKKTYSYCMNTAVLDLPSRSTVLLNFL